MLIGTRGGSKRVRILEALEVSPHSLEELATTLEIPSTTLQEHLDVLEANDMVDARKRPDDTEFVLAGKAPNLPE